MAISYNTMRKHKKLEDYSSSEEEEEASQEQTKQ